MSFKCRAFAVIFVCTILTGNCVGFGEARVPVSDSGAEFDADAPIESGAETNRAKIPVSTAQTNSAIEPGQISEIAVRFTAWGNHERYIDGVRERLILRGYRLRETSPALLEIVLEESGTTPGLSRLLNLVLTVGSGTLVPFYNQVNYRISFRYFRAGVLERTCGYELRNNEVIGVLFLPFAPFRWSTTTLAELLAESVDDYAYGCRSPDDTGEL